jgi:phosphoribosylamine--glycine ligase
MNVNGDPYVIEYNVRMGDPETQVVLPRVKNDLVELLLAAATGKLDGKSIETYSHHAVTVALVSGGYPGEYQKGKTIKGLQPAADALVFHAGTRKIDDHVVTDGGRVIAVTGMGPDLSHAREKAYEGVAQLSWEGLYFRKDIGQDLLGPVRP